MGLLPEFGPDSTFEHLSHYLNNRALRVTVRPPNGHSREWAVVLAPATRDERVGVSVGRGASVWAAANNAAERYDKKQKESE